MLKRRWRSVAVMRKMLTLAICVIGMVALFSVHVLVFSSSKVPDLPDLCKLPATTATQLHGISKYSRLESEQEQSLSIEITVPHLSKPPLPSRKLDSANEKLDLAKLWKPPPNRDYRPCVDPTYNYTIPLETRGYLIVHTNGGLNQMRAGFLFPTVLGNIGTTFKRCCKMIACLDLPFLPPICDMVAVARIINATLVVPELDKRSFWQDSSNFSDVFDDEHFIGSLANDVRVIKKLPKEMAGASKIVKHFRSWSGMDYYQGEIASLWKDFQVIRAAKSDSRLANNNLPPDIQKLRCRACYEALQFAPRIEAMGKLLVARMRSYGPYIALHLRYEKDMLAFSGCTHGLSSEEADELKKIREDTVYWKVKDIDSEEQRLKGYCPLTPKEVALFLGALGYPSNTPIYIAAGEIYGGQARIADLQSRFPILMNKEKLASLEELEPLTEHASQMAALDYIVSIESDVFVPSYSGNMARAVEGHRRFLGHRKTISPDRKALVCLFDKLDRGQMKEGSAFSNQVIEIHKRRQGSPRKRKGPISGTKGMDRFRTEEAFYVNPLPDCLCQQQSPRRNASFTSASVAIRL